MAVQRGAMAAISCDGQRLAEAYGAGARWLTHHAARINALNVFPVPDGDTGTNMCLTLQAAAGAAEAQRSAATDEVARAAAQAALLGARGNSGVILSQLLAGLAAGLQGRRQIDGDGFGAAAQEAARFAYKAVTAPVEGTILTAAAAVATAVQEAVDQGRPPLVVLTRAAQAARDAAVRTPELLPILRQAGVVDAGAEGLAIILEGVLRWARGESLDGAELPAFTHLDNAAMAEHMHVLEDNGYCTNFLVRDVQGSAEGLRQAILDLGTSAVVAAAGDLVKVHVHTEHPGLVLEAGARWGELTAIEITNMRDQVAAIQRPPTEERASSQPPLPVPDGAATGLVAVAPSAELAAVFGGFGVRAII
ncbi:MAG TPA: DAK2 domain-containing protein, partial [Chloroflexota bacterium]|nr:DAK2 domain-containing protein [Chloroflexota bacterium]